MRQLQFTDCVEIVGEACQPFSGYKQYVSTGAVAINHISNDDIELVDYDGKPSRANLIAKSGDILFAKMMGTKKTLHLDEDTAQNIYSTGFCAVRTRPTVLTDRCLYHLLTSKAFLDQKDKNCSGATQKAITNAGLSKITIKVPSIGQQASIAQQLDRIASIIALRQSELQKLDELIKARFVELFGEPRSNTLGFKKKRLKDTCKVITGNTPSRAESDYYGDYVEWIKTDNIVSGVLNPTQATESLSEKGMDVGRIVEKDSILMACIAGSIASIGRVCVTDRTVAFNQQINAIVPMQYNVLFLYVLLQMSKDYLVKDINMALKGILSKSKLEEKEFIVPPMELQGQFADFVEQTDKSKVVVQKALDEAQTLFDSLMQEYFG